MSAHDDILTLEARMFDSIIGQERLIERLGDRGGQASMDCRGSERHRFS